MITTATTINAPITIMASPSTRPSITDKVDEVSLELLFPVELPARIVVVTVTVAMERILVLVVVTMETDVVVTVVTLVPGAPVVTVETDVEVTVVTLVEVTGGLVVVRVTVVVPLLPLLARDKTHVHVMYKEMGINYRKLHLIM